MLRHDLTAVGRAINTLNQCFLPDLKVLSNSEEERYKRNELFQFYPELKVARNAIVEIVSMLRKVVKSDSSLTEGLGCDIPRANCTSLTYRTTRDSVSEGTGRSF